MGSLVRLVSVLRFCQSLLGFSVAMRFAQTPIECGLANAENLRSFPAVPMRGQQDLLDVFPFDIRQTAMRGLSRLLFVLQTAF